MAFALGFECLALYIIHWVNLRWETIFHSVTFAEWVYKFILVFTDNYFFQSRNMYIEHDHYSHPMLHTWFREIWYMFSLQIIRQVYKSIIYCSHKYLCNNIDNFTTEKTWKCEINNIWNQHYIAWSHGFIIWFWDLAQKFPHKLHLKDIHVKLISLIFFLHYLYEKVNHADILIWTTHVKHYYLYI